VEAKRRFHDSLAIVRDEMHLMSCSFKILNRFHFPIPPGPEIDTPAPAWAGLPSQTGRRTATSRLRPPCGRSATCGCPRHRTHTTASTPIFERPPPTRGRRSLTTNLTDFFWPAIPPVSGNLPSELGSFASVGHCFSKVGHEVLSSPPVNTDLLHQ
jgi:hypothetical protein